MPRVIVVGDILLRLETLLSVIQGNIKYMGHTHFGNTHVDKSSTVVHGNQTTNNVKGNQYNNHGSGTQWNQVYNNTGNVDQRQYNAGGDNNIGNDNRTNRVEGTGHRVVQGGGTMEGDRPTTNTRTVNIKVWVGGIGLALVAAKAIQTYTQQDNALAALADGALNTLKGFFPTASKLILPHTIAAS